MSTILEKIKSVKLCLMAHPDYEYGTEFEDRVSDLEQIENELSKDKWIKIKSKEDLPEQGGSYYVTRYGKVETAVYVKNDRWLVKGNDYPKTTNLHSITHYQPIIIPDLPLT